MDIDIRYFMKLRIAVWYEIAQGCDKPIIDGRARRQKGACCVARDFTHFEQLKNAI
jgi:hypothetical protein